MATKPAFTVIKKSELQKSRRGKPANWDPVLLEACALITDDEAAVALDTYGPFDKEKRGAFSTRLRAHFGQVHGTGPGTYKSQIDYSEDGVPQLSRGKLREVKSDD